MTAGRPGAATLPLQAAPGKPPKHFEYLADATKDPRADIVEFLLKNIGKEEIESVIKMSLENLKDKDIQLWFKNP